MAESAPIISVIIPTRNEADIIPILWPRLRAALDGTDHEVCFIDDSDDGTAELLERVRAEHPDTVRCAVRRGAERLGGLSTAVVTGLRSARGRFVCVMDSDLQHPPETIPSMLAAAQAGADLVVASRHTGGGSQAGLSGAGRRFVSAAARMASRLLFSEARRSGDPLSGFFLCRRDLIDGIEFRPVGFKILLELLVCVPQLEVVDVPLRFEARAAGRSKASAAQGLLFARHLWSLFTHVEGSARRWKFGLVGLSGLLVFLPLLALLTGPAHLAPLAAFPPAFAVSLAWNTTLNRLWTFADQRNRAAEGLRRYLESALAAGAVMLGAYALLIALHVTPVPAGTLSAMVAMIVNGVVSYPATRARPAAWARVVRDRGVQAALTGLTGRLGAERVQLLPAARSAVAGGAVPAELLARVVDTGRPALWTEAPSRRRQRRTNIELTSVILVPVVSDGTVLGVVVCERHAHRPFDVSALELAMTAGEGLSIPLAAVMQRPGPEPAARTPGAV